MVEELRINELELQLESVRNQLDIKNSIIEALKSKQDHDGGDDTSNNNNNNNNQLETLVFSLQEEIERKGSHLEKALLAATDRGRRAAELHECMLTQQNQIRELAAQLVILEHQNQNNNNNNNDNNNIDINNSGNNSPTSNENGNSSSLKDMLDRERRACAIATAEAEKHLLDLAKLEQSLENFKKNCVCGGNNSLFESLKSDHAALEKDYELLSRTNAALKQHILDLEGLMREERIAFDEERRVMQEEHEKDQEKLEKMGRESIVAEVSNVLSTITSCVAYSTIATEEKVQFWKGAKEKCDKTIIAQDEKIKQLEHQVERLQKQLETYVIPIPQPTSSSKPTPSTSPSLFDKPVVVARPATMRSLSPPTSTTSAAVQPSPSSVTYRGTFLSQGGPGTTRKETLEDLKRDVQQLCANLRRLNTTGVAVASSPSKNPTTNTNTNTSISSPSTSSSPFSASPIAVSPWRSVATSKIQQQQQQHYQLPYPYYNNRSYFDDERSPQKSLAFSTTNASAMSNHYNTNYYNNNTDDNSFSSSAWSVKRRQEEDQYLKSVHAFQSLQAPRQMML